VGWDRCGLAPIHAPTPLLAREYVEHYHRERNHQGLDNRLLQHPPPSNRRATKVRRRERLGGLLNFYHREAA
jgi:putative transposase